MRHPMQQIIVDDKGTPRFRKNPIVRFLLDAGPFDLNQIAMLPGISKEDHEQFAQLIGYSVAGFGELSYASSAAVLEADAIVEGLLDGKEGKDETT